MSENPEFVERFIKREERPRDSPTTTSSRAIDVGSIPRRYHFFAVMEYVEGKTPTTSWPCCRQATADFSG